MIYMGVDPGKKGGFAVISADLSGKQRVEVFPWDDDGFVREMVMWCGDFAAQEGGGLVACVEKVGSMPHDSHKAAFNFGHSLGYIEGILIALGTPYQLAPPNVWKREFSLIGKDKAASVEVCKRLFPGVDLRPTEKCRKDSDGMAEALLMAEYARRKF